MKTVTPLELASISKHFQIPASLGRKLAARITGKPVASTLQALEAVSLSLGHREIVALVGESGCGKSTAGRIAAGAIAASGGEVRYAGKPLSTLRGHYARQQRLAVQMVFQNPREALNPRMRVDRILAEPALRHGFTTPARAAAYTDDLMRAVGLDSSMKSRFPHELSGGQCQRVGIARALAVQPDVLVCDEALSALDVSVQAQILNLFLDLRETLALSFLFISHDLSVVERISDRVAVMYLGRIVELADTQDIFSRAHHPYTEALLAAAPRLDQRRQTYGAISGEVPSPLAPPSGCHFHPRCPHATARCALERPPLREVTLGQWSACFLDFRN
ncbi:oligopeptide/dipeptide ABC transporter ATP-binding protein [Ochrobactrum vermis]|uniref:Oligopeptide/dipeptide ABC transporter ATP-binding protein n=1 Tax=Ochrobactrum vermis TaxID=1827297 RepID=A0ABU8PF99_9HYPH|nr:oligopeptide/dipeptide ABC transporter ATP-binding protein [Ochrobactrum vermis]PQZ25357.1 peptide ABC transporter ATP-binding protein [Ochrobactrum vermis]